MLTTEHKKRSQHMEAVKNLDQTFLDSYIDVPPPPVKSKPKAQRKAVSLDTDERANAAIGIFNAILLAIPLWALIIYGIMKLID